ncbi:MAG: VWA domain-containing protein [Leptospiraceae bacterium]|nr:VWA domain-containing protein [Leptospiraceae bacterium]
MFIDFFYRLKQKKIPVTTGELLDLLKSLQSFTEERAVLSLNEFYNIARSCLVKDVKYYDDYDLVFASVFSNIGLQDSEFKKMLEDWLKQAIQKKLSEEQKLKAPNLSYEDLLKELEKRLKEQKERHDGGNYWVGTRGTSPFGNSGYNPKGIRIGGEGGGKSAIEVASERHFAEYRTDETLNVRHIKIALKRLRLLRKEGRETLSVPKTIKKTCDNAGDLEFIFEKNRKNNLKLLLLMDVGGSMTPYAKRVNKLFSAGHQLNHFKEFHYYYFHNVIYDYVYQDASFYVRVPIDRLLKKLKPDTRVIFVGDAYMNPYELFQQAEYSSAYNYFFNSRYNEEDEEDHLPPKTGIQRLQEFSDYFEKSVWLNPEDKRLWRAPTIDAISGIVPMYFLSIEGIQEGMKHLL